MLNNTIEKTLEEYLQSQALAYGTESAAEGVEKREDEEGIPYIWIPVSTSGFHAEIDGETFGTLQGFRYYL